MWKIIELFYNREKRKINKDISIFVGNNAGRISQSMSIYKKVVSKKIDSSCVDRAFATNIGLPFYTPEMFFLGDTIPITWSYGINIMDQDTRKLLINDTHQPNIKNELDGLPKSDKYIIIVTGPPSCGKTTLTQKLKKKWDSDYKMGDITHISENKYDDDIQIYDDIQSTLNTNSVIIDINCYLDNIQKITKIVVDLNISGIIIDIKSNQNTSILFNFMQVQMSKKTNVIVKNVSTFNNFYKQYIPYKLTIIPQLKYIQFPMNVQFSDEFLYNYSY